MKSEVDIALNQFRIHKEQVKNIINECKRVIDSNKILHNNGLINFNPSIKLEELIKLYDASD